MSTTERTPSRLVNPFPPELANTGHAVLSDRVCDLSDTVLDLMDKVAELSNRLTRLEIESHGAV